MTKKLPTQFSPGPEARGESAIKAYDNYEISGCAASSEYPYDIEPVADSEAQFWTLYGHIRDEGVEAVGDFATREAAEQVYYRITGQPFTGSYKADAHLRVMQAGPKLLKAARLALRQLKEFYLDQDSQVILDLKDAIRLATEEGSMTKYLVTAWCDRSFFAQCEVDAETPHEALAKARQAIADAPAEECDEGYDWDEWRVDTPEADGVLLHLDDQARLRDSAASLLAACQMVVDRWERGDLAEAARACRVADAEATGRAA